MRAVVALGGNALARRGERADPGAQRVHLRRAAAAVAELAREHELVLTHDNGPQIGLLALQAESCLELPRPTLDVLGAECEGGGGIPVAVTPDGGLRGVEAVIDKDLASALLASEVGAQALLLLTDVPAVFEDWPEARRRPLRCATPAELRRLRFEPGSMAPRVEAACRFVEAGGGFAAIGALEDAARLLAGETGTRVASSPTPGRAVAIAPATAPSRRR